MTHYVIETADGDKIETPNFAMCYNLGRGEKAYLDFDEVRNVRKFEEDDE